jgi:hypothetical protein
MLKPKTTELLPTDEAALRSALRADGLSNETIETFIRKKRTLEALPYWARLSNGRGPQALYTVINFLHRPVHKLEYLWRRYIRGNEKARDLIGAWPKSDGSKRWVVFSK